VSNNQQGLWYMCSCCTCSCGILRGMADLGIANVVARSSFVNTVDQEQCVGCELCLASCQFKALSMESEREAKVDRQKCVGCGVCADSCPEGALALVLRPEEEMQVPPLTLAEWMAARAVERGIDLGRVLSGSRRAPLEGEEPSPGSGGRRKARQLETREAQPSRLLEPAAALAD